MVISQLLITHQCRRKWAAIPVCKSSYTVKSEFGTSLEFMHRSGPPWEYQFQQAPRIRQAWFGWMLLTSTFRVEFTLLDDIRTLGVYSASPTFWLVYTSRRMSPPPGSKSQITDYRHPAAAVSLAVTGLQHAPLSAR